MLHSLYGVDVGVDLLIKMNSRNMEKYAQLCQAANVDQKVGLSFTQFFELHENLSVARIKSQLGNIVLNNKARVIEIIFALSDEDKDGFINLKEMQQFTATMDRWYDKMSSLPSSTLSRLVAMGDTVVKVLNLGRKNEEK